MATLIKAPDLMETSEQKEAVEHLSPGVARTKITKAPRGILGLLAIAVIVVASVVADRTFKDSAFVPGSGNSPVDGMTIFAVFFVGATAIERLLEPFSSAILPQDAKKAEAADKTKSAKKASETVADQVQTSGEATADANNKAEAALKSAAEAEQKVTDTDWGRKVLFWVIASVVAMFAAASLKLYFLGTVGMAHASRWEEILATGLILGAGTKPLHDLTELISAKKDAEKM